MKGTISLFLLLSFFVIPAPADTGDPSYLSELLTRADAEKLYQDRYWEILLHYKPSGKGLLSLVDDPRFFLSPTGKGDPKAELEATIKGFFDNDKNDQEHPRCRFPARFAWLKERLIIDESRLPPVACTQLDDALKAVNPKSAVLVFPAAHTGGPASMFGHTLLRVDSGSESELISYAITYAATATDTNGFVYAFKGIFGYYNGNYSILPYYEKVKEYNDMEQRDIWEYQLNLTEEETRRLILHIWELKDANSDYYFFDENCSYNILFLLEAARPSVNLTDRSALRFWVIPVDTVRDVEKSGLVQGVKYRPSMATRIRFLASLLEKERRGTALGIANGEISPEQAERMQAPEEERARTLDLAAELIQYKYSRREIGKEEYQKRFLSALKSRSRLWNPVSDLPAIVAPASPDKGHLSSRLGIASGYRTDSAFSEIKWRGAYHDLQDPDDGYIEGYQINFFDASIRYFYRDDKLQFTKLNFIDILSVSPRDEFVQPLSWKAKTGFVQKFNKAGEEHLVYQVNLGGGLSYKYGPVGLFYGLIETDVDAGGAYRDNFAAGAGAEIGLIRKITDSWKFNLTAEAIHYGLGDRFDDRKASLVQTWRLGQNNSLNLSASREKVGGRRLSETALTWNHYF